MPEVSFIVPVYNAERSVGKLIESVLNQEYRDLELILVDDGSKDGSPAILDQYQAKDERVKVIHKPNGGVSAARNDGLQAASGTYIRFLDADDWIPDDSTKEMVRAIKETGADLVVGDFYRVVGDNLAKKGSIPSEKLLTTEEYAEYMMESPADYYYGVIWNKLYRKDLIEQYKIRFDKTLSFCEDFVFNLEYVLHTKTILPLQVPVYYYVKTEGSLVSQNINPVRLVRMKTSLYSYYDQFFRKILDEEEYRAQRGNIASFLVAAATDEFTIPMMPGTKKLGEETIPVYYFDDENEDIYTAITYMKLAYERYMNTIAMKHSLELPDIKVLNYLKHAGRYCSQKEISCMTGVPQTTILGSLQKLNLKGFVTLEIHETGLAGMYVRNEDLEKEFADAQNDMKKLCTNGMDEQEVSRIVRGIAANLKEHLK